MRPEILVGPLLAVLALILVLPGPAWVRHWAFLDRVPRAAIVLWQAGTVAALVAAVGAGVRVGLDLWQHRPAERVWVAAMALAALFAGSVVVRLVWSVVAVARETGHRRARHRAAVDIVARASRERGLRVLAEAAPMAYCLPGLRDARVVLSQGTLDTLAPDEVAAVLAHERAHLRARHDVVLDFFTALHRAFPHAVRSDIALTECRELVEMLADDAARRRVGPESLARALVSMAGSPVPRHALGAGGQVLRRVRRLRHDHAHPVLAAGVYALAAGLVALPAVILAIGS
ncbi:Zn-dependent protease with chaperone function [Naumannella cuiyingiana]|uniref:Zn-dependent protease with chaperone function n=1 Tax=Naumannella cuiyingiana TaxID=1347891 RepID=A0A7Z0IL21_9ACTN|nr:M56 family metallopeptidase [Naumannella cuiyingiana]NYI71121.1 Zn-dependent protease with chaperone function [Naumannella cuiyingiana]